MAWRPKETQRFFEELLRQVPEFTDQFREHIEDEGELLPIVLMDGFSRFIVDNFNRSSSNDPGHVGSRDVFERSISFLNEEYKSSGEDVQILINTTFSETLETLWRDKKIFIEIYTMLSPKLQATVNVVK